jgi:asparagine synthetase A
MKMPTSDQLIWESVIRDKDAEIERLRAALKQIRETVQFAEYESREWDVAKLADAALSHEQLSDTEKCNGLSWV